MGREISLPFVGSSRRLQPAHIDHSVLSLIWNYFSRAEMIWVVRKFITHQILDTGPERVKFPIRVELEYQAENGEVSFESLKKKVLYNKSFLLKRYPQLTEADLDLLVEERIQKAIQDEFTPSRGTE